ncbi:hypothetical protein Mth01_20350 [Sphaerimonospora thailandensis]|uniref:Uncharacterized protein n=1 Tax=Sphaerimonospora thailandensis TaxID=795644 RepID=A0A8J3VYS8_9ACTN|nr:hypothetical protein Mth01_20350 [Sphaerimonospora thailandensis]
MDVVVFAVELTQLDLEVGAHLPHDLLAAGQYLVREHPPPIFRDKHQMRVKVRDDMTSRPDVRVRFPPR